MYNPEKPPATTILDLSGGGARIENPGIPVKPGNRLILTLRAGDEQETLTARIIRISHGDEHLRLQFEGLSEAVRDRLIGLVFRTHAAVETGDGPIDQGYINDI